MRVDGLCGKVQAYPHRDWRLDRALLACKAAPAMSGQELEAIIGHMTVSWGYFAAATFSYRPMIISEGVRGEVWSLSLSFSSV